MLFRSAMTNLELAKRAVACKHWRLLPGMMTEKHGRVHDVGDGMILVQSKPTAYMDNSIRLSWQGASQAIPDFSDPLTAAGVLVLVREAWNTQQVTLRVFDDESAWIECALPGQWKKAGDSVAEALIAALEEAP